MAVHGNTTFPASAPKKAKYAVYYFKKEELVDRLGKFKYKYFEANTLENVVFVNDITTVGAAKSKKGIEMVTHLF